MIIIMVEYNLNFILALILHWFKHNSLFYFMCNRYIINCHQLSRLGTVVRNIGKKIELPALSDNNPRYFSHTFIAIG
jgi:hypothetical protein